MGAAHEVHATTVVQPLLYSSSDDDLVPPDGRVSGHAGRRPVPEAVSNFRRVAEELLWPPANRHAIVVNEF